MRAYRLPSFILGLLLLVSCARPATPTQAPPSPIARASMEPTVVTSIAPSPTLMPATSTPVAPTRAAVAHSSTPDLPTNTPLLPTSTSLPPTSTPLPPTSTSLPSTTPLPAATATSAPPQQPDPALGAKLWPQLPCSGCHGPNAEGDFGPRLAGTGLSIDQVLARVRLGKGPMPAFPASEVSDLTVRHVYAWLRSLAKPAPTPIARPSFPTQSLSEMWTFVNEMRISAGFAKDLPVGWLKMMPVVFKWSRIAPAMVLLRLALLTRTRWCDCLAFLRDPFREALSQPRFPKEPTGSWSLERPAGEQPCTDCRGEATQGRGNQDASCPRSSTQSKRSSCTAVSCSTHWS